MKGHKAVHTRGECRRGEQGTRIDMLRLGRVNYKVATIYQEFLRLSFFST